MRRTCPPEKKFRIICGGYPSTNVLRYSQMTFSENNCERYSFSAQKVCEGMFAFDISNIFRSIFFCVSQKHILKTLAKCFWEIPHRKHVNKDAYPKHFCSQFNLSAAKFPMFREFSGKCLLLSIWQKISQQKILTTFERYEA